MTGHGLWLFRQISCTEYQAITSHELNKMTLKLPLSKVAQGYLARADCINLKLQVVGTSVKKDDKYKIGFKLLHGPTVLKDAGTGE